MKNPNLLTRSSYTFFSSLLKISDIVSYAKKNGYENAFLIDKNIMYGAMEFYLLCKKNNIKPIIGLEINIDNKREVLIAKNLKGYKELMRLSSKIQLENNNIVIDYENLIKFNNLVSPVLYKGINDIVALKDFYSIGIGEFKESSTHFLDRKEFELTYGKETLKEVDLLIDKVELEINESKNILPNFIDNGEKVDSKVFLELKLKEKLKKILNDDKTLDRKKYIDRTSFELSIINKMKFESYFLIVSDIVEWAKNKKIFVGPGRGSAPGSMISYLLNITTIDPIKNGLLFERFLNPDRITMPDIDIDFEDSRRDEVIEYISNKYGKNNVAQIITYQTLRARMSFKDIARIKGLSASETNVITKVIPEELSLEEGYKKSKAFREMIDSSELHKSIFESAKLVEGLPRQFSTHAAGIVISDSEIYKSVPVQKGYGNFIQTQYSMDYMEYNGLLKIDILGLRNLSFIKETINLIKENSGISINIEDISFDEKKVYQIFSMGKTMGIFQFESPGMRAALKEIGVSNFEEIVATTSLFRPGPMKMISTFALRKKGIESINYLNEEIKKVLELTYGIMIYQEQIMKIVQIFSSFTLSKADILRRAIGKKDIKLLESLKEDFFKGAKNNGFPENVIQETYDHIYEFSNYGFNRSHAFAYSTISYWLGWLKVNYPLEFMTSLLNSVIGNSSKTSLYISECEDNGIKIMEPSLFDSKRDYLIKDKNIFISLRAIKRVGDSILKKIEEILPKINKEMSLIDLFIVYEKNDITMSSVEILIKSNALRDFNYNKETLLTNIPKIYEYLKMIKVKKEDKIDFDKTIIPEPSIIKVDPIKENEYFLEVMGFSLQDKEKKKEFDDLEKKLNIKKIEFSKLSQDSKIELIGEIISVRAITTKAGKNMAFGFITNGERKINITLWPTTYDKYVSLLNIGKKLFISGKIDFKRGETIIVSEMREVI